MKNKVIDTPSYAEIAIKKAGLKTSDVIRNIYYLTGLTYKEITSKVGIKRNTFANWLMGRRNPPYIVVDYICDKLDISLDEAIAYKPQK